MKKLSFVFALIIASTLSSVAQLKLPALSPTCKISQDFSTSTIDISYSRPSMRGRTVFGDVVAYGSVWRTGANAATKVKFGEDVAVNGINVKAGEYALYTIPGKTEWTVILNKGTGNWGAFGYETTDDVARFTIKPKALNKDIQTFTINVTDLTYSTCNIELVWEKTKISIPVVANNKERLNADIDKAINKPNIPYFSAANYYYETNQNMDKAYEYVNKALVDNPKAYYMWDLKARMAKKMGKKDDAIAAAKQTIETAKGTASEAEYAHKGQSIIDSYAKN